MPPPMYLHIHIFVDVVHIVKPYTYIYIYIYIYIHIYIYTYRRHLHDDSCEHMSEFCLPQPPRRQKIIYDETQELDPDFAKFYKETQDIVNDVLMKEGGVLFQEITDENEVSSQ